MNHQRYSNLKLGNVLFAVTLAVAIIAGSVVITAVNTKSAGPTAGVLLPDPIKTDAGYVSGTVIGDVEKEVRIYRGIPYAAPPVGDLRWKPPQPVTPWKGIKECTKFGPWATQFTWTGAWMNEIQVAGMSEDCLHLNVLTPAKTAAQKLPVLVWLHDGGLDAGSGNRPLYNNPDLAQHGLVLVTISHRIGAMGLVSHPGLTAESPNHASGNYEMLDVVAALKWVKQNIAAFGGDPGCVTIMGQSGGGSKVGWLLASPLAKGLFHRAIIEGSGISSALALEKAEAQGEKIAAKLGANNIAELRAKSWQDILTVVPPPRTRNSDLILAFAVDGWSLTDTPINTVSKGQGYGVPVLWGGGEAEAGVYKGIVATAPGLIKANPNLYVYMFTHIPANLKNAGLKAFHGLELFYEFGGYELPSERAAIIELSGQSNQIPAASVPKDVVFDKTDGIIAENSMKMWVQFAKTGDPSVPGLAKWPAYKATAGEDKYVDISNPLAVKAGLMEKFKQ